MRHSDSISSVQLAAIVISTMLGVSLLIIPKMVVDYVGVAAPLATVMGIGISFFGILGFALLGRRFPKETIISYNKTILGKYFGNVFNAGIILVAITLFGLEARQFAEVLAGALLPNTPIFVSVFLMVVICASINFSNVSTFAFIHFFYLPFLIIPLFIVIGPSFGDAELYHLFPIIGYDVTLSEFYGGAKLICQGIANFIIISMVIPYMKRPKNSVKSSIWGFLIASSFIFSTVTICLAVFGENKITDMYWPTLVLARMVQVPGEVFSRVDAIFLIAWIFAVFTTLLSYYFIFVRGFCEMLNSKKFRIVSLAGIPITILIALMPQDTYDLYSYIKQTAFIGAITTIPFPLLLLMIAKIRRKKGV